MSDDRLASLYTMLTAIFAILCFLSLMEISDKLDRIGDDVWSRRLIECQ